MLRGGFDPMAMLYVLPGLLLALSVHEFAHGYAAYKLGDDTAKLQGRLTLDPIKHIDPIGFLMLLFMGFGWAKPVMVNKRNFKYPKRDDNIVSLAGPFSNFILALLLAGLAKVLLMIPINGQLSEIILTQLYIVLLSGVAINIGLGVFNLIPIPPLDGSHVLFNMLPSKFYYNVMQNYDIVRFGFLILLATGILGGMIGPIIQVINLWIFGIFELPF